ncbi:hypothetical protein [Cupriavidus sp. TMH.W2]|uniref:hypothetical protein n=1 Tax=Cupriavidus sp. TMH.W2 TaxID=3434465 RepID=UPI003D76DBB6
MKPLQDIVRIAKEWHWDLATLQQKRRALTNAYSLAAFHDPQTLAVFAHGDELVRARQWRGRAAVETYNIHVESWDLRAIDLFEWEAVQAAAGRHTHADGRTARIFVTLPVWVSPEAATSLPVTPLYPRTALCPQGYGVFEQIDNQLHLLAAYHRGHADRARLLTCELLVHDESSASAIQKALTAIESPAAPKDWRRINAEDLAAMAKANAAPRGTKFPQVFRQDAKRADPAYLPVSGVSPAWSVEDFLDYAATPAFAELVSVADRATGIGLPAAKAAIARAIFDYTGPHTEPGDAFDLTGFARFCAGRFERRAPQAQSAKAASCALEL